jgi:hypothetical protein
MRFRKVPSRPIGEPATAYVRFPNRAVVLASVLTLLASPAVKAGGAPGGVLGDRSASAGTGK